MTTPVGGASVFGGIGKLEWAPTNAPDDPFPTYVDITPYVRTEQTDLAIARGRDSNLNAFQPGQLTCILDNSDFRFTFGNTSGPYGSNWQPAKQVRYSETIGSRTFVLFKGWIEYPDIPSWLPIGYQEVQLTATDRLARLARGTPFISTLTEYIRYNARNGALKGYWPMSGVGSALSYPDITGQQPNLLQLTTANNPNSRVITQPFLAPSFNQSPIGPGDDLPSVVLNFSAANVNGSTNLFALLGPGGAGINLGANQVVTIVAWIQPNLPDLSVGGVSQSAIPFGLLTTETPARAGSNIQFNGSNQATWFGGAFGNLSWSNFTGVPIENGWALPVAVQYGINPQVTHFWIGGQEITPYSSGGSLPTALTLNSIWAPENAYAGAIGHLQLYVGAATDFTFADLQAQQTMGYNGLEAQTTGQRVNTILNYAGVSATDRQVDPGVSYMSKSTLAGRAPADVLAEAVTAEQGRGFALGTGPYAFHDRQRVMNV